MKYNILIIISYLCFFNSCKKHDLKDKSIQIVKEIQSGNIKAIKNQFYSTEYLNELGNISKSIDAYKSIIQNLEIDKKENIIENKVSGVIRSKFLSKDTINIYNIHVPIGIELPSIIPKYFMMLQFIKKKNDFKLIGLDLKSTKIKEEDVNLDIKDKIQINVSSLKRTKLMYDGAHKSPMLFKQNILQSNESILRNSKLMRIIEILNNSAIVKSKIESDVQRFNGNPELSIIKFELDNNHNWRLFQIESEEENIKEDRYGQLELRYFEFANQAISYWIETEKITELKKLIYELCQTGKNVKTRPKESIKLELEKN